MQSLLSRTALVAAVVLVSPGARAQLAPASSPGTVQSFAMPTDLPLSVELGVMLDGEPVEIMLSKRTVRAIGYEGYVAEADGLRVLDPVATSTYRGAIEGRPGSLVGAWLSPDGLHATIVDAAGAWVVEPAGGARDLHRVMRFDEIPSDGFECQVIAAAYNSATERAGASAGGAAETGLALAEIAYDADSVMLSRFADSSALQSAVEGVIAQSSVIYEYYVGIQYAVSGAVVRTTANDPYLAQGLGVGSNPSTWLSAFRTRWNYSANPEAGIDCDVAHLFTGHGSLPGASGIAYLGVVCNDNWHYGLSTYPGSSAILLRIFSHELGHNWNACHCNLQNPCFDSGCGIMYASTSGGLGLVFGSVSTTSITTWKNSHSCFGTGSASAAPSISSVSPAQVPALGNLRVTVDGDDLDKTVLVYMDSTTLNLSSLYLIDDETIEFSPPRATALGTVDVQLDGPGGASGVEEVEYVSTSPPDILVDVGPDTIQGATWTYGGLVGKNAVVLLAVDDDTTTTVGSFQVLANGSTADSATLTDPGLESFSRTIPAALIGSTLYLQVLIYDGATLIEVSAVRGFDVTG